MKKNLKILIAIFFFVLFFSLPTKIIFGKADFPDSKKLQPAPADIKPNISGNVNSNLDKNETTENFLQNLIFPDENKNNVTPESGAISGNTYKTGYLLKIFLFLVISFIFLLAFIFVRKKNK